MTSATDWFVLVTLNAGQFRFNFDLYLYPALPARQAACIEQLAMQSR